MTLRLHRLLRKQIKHLGLSLPTPPSNPQKWNEFIALINETYKAEDKERYFLEKQATHDALTGLLNRTILIDRIRHAISIETRKGGAFGVLFFDLDHFKSINDEFTHQVGDKLLRLIANRLQSSFRLGDTIARVGGDEFVMLAPGLATEESISNVARRLINLFQDSFCISGQDISITASIGISVYPKDGKTVQGLLTKADKAMYRAKTLGHNQFQFYKTGSKQHGYVHLKKEDKLRMIVENKEFFSAPLQGKDFEQFIKESIKQE